MNLVADKTTALGTAARNGQYRCIELLISTGATVNISDPSVTPPLICGAISVNHANSIKHRNTDNSRNRCECSKRQDDGTWNCCK